MAWEWIIWGLLIIITFWCLEAFAFKHPDREWTLSKSVAYLGQRWPLSIFIQGLVVGGLAVHFFWHWCGP